MLRTCAFMKKSPKNPTISMIFQDHVWSFLDPHLPGRKSLGGRLAKNNRKITNAVFWILRTGPPWRNPPLDYAGGSKPYRQFIGWKAKGI